MFLLFALSSFLFTSDFQPSTSAFEVYKKRTEIIDHLQSDLEEIVAAKNLSAAEIREKVLSKIKEVEDQIAKEAAVLTFDRGGQMPFNSDSLGEDTTRKSIRLTARERAELLAKLEPRMSAEDFASLKDFFAKSNYGFSILVSPPELIENKIVVSRDLSDRTLSRVSTGVFSLAKEIQRLNTETPMNRSNPKSFEVRDLALVVAHAQIRADLLQAKLNPEDYFLIVTPPMFCADKKAANSLETFFVFENSSKLIITRKRERSTTAVPFTVADCAAHPRKVWIFKKSDLPSEDKEDKSQSHLEISVVDENVFPR